MNFGIRLRKFLQEYCTVDLRSLATWRIVLGCCITLDLLSRMVDLQAHYTDAGILPRGFIVDLLNNSSFFSLYLGVGNPISVGILFLIHLALALAFTFGFRTRLVTILLFAFEVSLHNRAHILLSGADTVMRLGLFWSIFVPIGDRWSLDAKNERPTSHAAIVWALPIFVLQIFAMYFFAALAKKGDHWHENYDAVYHALSHRLFQTPIAAYMIGFPIFLKFVTWIVWWVELVVPFLLFVPFRIPTFRTIAVLILIGLQVSFALHLWVDFFPWVSIGLLIAILPPTFWRFIFSQKLSREKVPVAGPNRWILAAGYACLAYSLAWLHAEYRPQYHFPSAVQQPGLMLRLDQHWAMFAPNVGEYDGWYSIPAKTKSGREVDLWTGVSPVPVSPPDSFFSHYRNIRWKKYLECLHFRDYSRYRQAAANFFCKDWNENHTESDRVEKLSVVFHRRKILAPEAGFEEDVAVLIESPCPSAP